MGIDKILNSKNKPKVNPKLRQRKIQTWVRAAIQLIFFILFPSVFTAAFNGVKYIFTQIGAGNQVEFTSFVTVLAVICIYTIIFGRFFCGFACAFGSFGDAVRAIYVWCCKKLKKKPVSIPENIAKGMSYIKYVIVIAIALLCYMGAYSKLKGTSPWDVFSMFRAGNFKIAAYVTGLILLLVIIAGMCVQERFFCRFLCPMGAVFSLLPILPFFTLHRDRSNCIKGCSACGRICPCDIGLPEDGSAKIAGDCFQCQKCNAICPKTNIHTGINGLRGNEIWFTIARAVILIAICVLLGI